MVADDEQLELRHEVEEVLPHEARGYLVAPGHRLDLGLVPSSALLGLLGDDQSVTMQFGEVGRMSFGVAGDEGADIGNGGIVAEDGREVLMKVPLPLAPVP